MTDPRHAYHEAVPDITDKVWVRVASHLKGDPALILPTTDEDSGSEGEEATTPALRMKGLKSGKICTADTTVLRKTTWPYTVSYTSICRAAHGIRGDECDLVHQWISDSDGWGER